MAAGGEPDRPTPPDAAPPASVGRNGGMQSATVAAGASLPRVMPGHDAVGGETAPARVGLRPAPAIAF